MNVRILWGLRFAEGARWGSRRPRKSLFLVKGCRWADTEIAKREAVSFGRGEGAENAGGEEELHYRGGETTGLFNGGWGYVSGGRPTRCSPVGLQKGRVGLGELKYGGSSMGGKEESFLDGNVLLQGDLFSVVVGGGPVLGLLSRRETIITPLKNRKSFKEKVQITKMGKPNNMSGSK